MSPAQSWIDKASADISAADILFASDNPPYEIICFHCQQAIEKYFKAFLDFHSIDIPRTHDLDVLLKLCLTITDQHASINRMQIAVLTDFAVNFRYPGEYAVPDAEETQNYITLAKQIQKFTVNLFSH